MRSLFLVGGSFHPFNGLYMVLVDVYRDFIFVVEISSDTLTENCVKITLKAFKKVL